MKRFIVFKVGFSFEDWTEFDDLQEAIKFKNKLNEYGYNAILFVRLDFCDDMIDEN